MKKVEEEGTEEDQEEREKNFILNKRAEYSCCTIPRQTAKMGNKEINEEVEKEQVEDKRVEEKVRSEEGKMQEEGGQDP